MNIYCKHLRIMRLDGIEASIVCTALLIVIVLALAIYVDSKKWEDFKSTHNCKLVTKINGENMITTTYGPSGQVQTGITSTPEKTGWRCDDGVTYFR